MHRTLSLLAVVAVAGLVASPHSEAADFYKETLAPGADAGTTALTTSIISGNQYMLRCSTYGVTYKLCSTGAPCTATANDSNIDADQSVDICGLYFYTQLSVFRTYDGGVGACRVFLVNPPSPNCKM